MVGQVRRHARPSLSLKIGSNIRVARRQPSDPTSGIKYPPLPAQVGRIRLALGSRSGDRIGVFIIAEVNSVLVEPTWGELTISYCSSSLPSSRPTAPESMANSHRQFRSTWAARLNTGYGHERRQCLRRIWKSTIPWARCARVGAIVSPRDAVVYWVLATDAWA